MQTGNNQSAFIATAVVAPPAVIAKDKAGTPVGGVSVTFAVTGGGGSITGATATSGTDGVAALGSWTLGNLPGANTLTATAAGLTGSPVTFTATGTAGPATKLVVTNPTATTAGAPLLPVQVTVQDPLGNTVVTATNAISVALTSGTGVAGATLTGTLTQPAVSGVATFSNLTIDKAGTGYTLTVSSAGLTSGTTAPIDISVGAPAKLAVTVQPGTVVAGTVINPAVQVTVQDAQGNTVISATTSIALAITGGTGTAGAVLGGTLSRAAVNGVASFNNLTLNKSGAGYTLTTTATSLAAATSASFAVTAGAPTQIAFAVQPGAVVAGAALGPAVQVTVQDAFGNTVTGSTAAITLAITAGTGTAGATLGGTLTQAAVSGVASFANLTVDKVGSGYTLTAAATGLTNATSASFAVNPGAAARLVYTAQPSAVSAGAAIAPAIQVTVQDALGNTVTSSTANVTLAITSGTGTSGAVLGGSFAMAAVSGVATFTNLTIDKAGAGYSLTATSTGLASATSALFAVSAGTPAKLAFAVPPGAVVAGTVMSPSLQVTVQDSLGNTVTSATTSITLSFTPGTGPVGLLPVLGGTLTQPAVNGIATFGNVTIDKAGTSYSLTASSAGLTSAVSAPFTVVAGTATKLVFENPIASNFPVTAGVVITTVLRVTVQDAQGNTVTSSAASVTIAITSGTGTIGAVLGGTLTQSVVNGAATFSNLTIDKAGTNYSFTATATGLPSVTSVSFAVSPGAAARLAFTVQPSTAAAGAVITPAVQVTVQDTLGNTVTSATSIITLAITSGSGTTGAVLGGTLTRAAVSGVASFNNLTVDRAGTGYTLSAASTGLTGAASASFAITALASQLSVFVGNNQTGLIGYPVNVRPAVRVLDAGNAPVANVSVTFSVLSGGGSVTTATVNTNALGIAQVGKWTLGAVAGANSLTATAGVAMTGSPATFSATGVASTFNITIQNVGPAFSLAVQAAFDSATAFWQRAIIGDIPDVASFSSGAGQCGTNSPAIGPITVDDVLILARFDSIDGPGQVLGSAGPCFVRTTGRLTIAGTMRFDTADVAGLINNGSLNAVIRHEMGHVLGFGTLWTQTAFNCLQNASSTGNVLDTYFSCAKGQSAFDSIGGTSYTGGLKVPVENCGPSSPGGCGAGTVNSHWREPTFLNELMTGYLNSGSANPASLITIAAMEDLAYQVNYGAAEAYTRIFTAPAALRAAATLIDLAGDVLSLPIRVMDSGGRVVQVINP